MLSAILAPALKYICGGLLFLTVILGIALKVERIHSHKLDRRIVELSAELKRISTAKSEQKIVTRDRIIIATRKAKDADGVAKKIEAAPLIPGCKTPPAIMGADL